MEERIFSTKTRERKTELGNLLKLIKSILYEKMPIFCKHVYGEKKSLIRFPRNLKWIEFLEFFGHVLAVDYEEVLTKYGVILKTLGTVEENIKILEHLENILSHQYTIIIGAEDYNNRFPDFAINIDNFNDAIIANNLLIEYESDF